MPVSDINASAFFQVSLRMVHTTLILQPFSFQPWLFPDNPCDGLTQFITFIDNLGLFTKTTSALVFLNPQSCRKMICQVAQPHSAYITICYKCNIFLKFKMLKLLHHHNIVLSVFLVMLLQIPFGQRLSSSDAGISLIVNNIFLRTEDI